MTVKIPRDYYGTRSEIFKTKQIEINPGITILTGCNGAGKSTFMKIVKDKCERDNIPYYYYDGASQGHSEAQQYALDFDIKFFMISAMSSEGEWVLGAFNMRMDKLIKFIKGSKPGSDIVVLLDATDSGLSIDAIIPFRELLDVINEDYKKKNINVYLIVSVNNFELARDYDCVYPVTGKYIKFTEYEDYRNFVLESAKARDTRYNKATAKKTKKSTRDTDNITNYGQDADNVH